MYGKSAEWSPSSLVASANNLLSFLLTLALLSEEASVALQISPGLTTKFQV